MTGVVIRLFETLLWRLSTWASQAKAAKIYMKEDYWLGNDDNYVLADLLSLDIDVISLLRQPHSAALRVLS